MPIFPKTTKRDQKHPFATKQKIQMTFEILCFFVYIANFSYTDFIYSKNNFKILWALDSILARPAFKATLSRIKRQFFSSKKKVVKTRLFVFTFEKVGFGS